MKKSLMMAVLIVGCAPEPAEPTRLDGGIENADTGQTQTDAGLEVDAGSAPDVGTTPTERTIWAGPRLTFTKANFADPNTPEAQDRITDSVILTRGSRNILYNIAEEAAVNQSVSPAGTLWALGTTDTIDSLDFQPLKQAANSRMQDLPNQDMVLHLIEENIYIDLRFLSWTSGGASGGGFSYERTTANP